MANIWTLELKSEPLEGAVMWDEKTNQVFGPVFETKAECEDFVTWAEDRVLPDPISGMAIPYLKLDSTLQPQRVKFLLCRFRASRPGN